MKKHIDEVLRKIFFLFFGMFFFVSFSQEEVLRFDYINLKDGLSSNWVNSITEDTRGFLWVGTRDGVSVFDGENSFILRNDPKDDSSLSGDDVSFITYSKSQNIVLGTWGAGVNVVDPITKEITRVFSSEASRFFNIKSLAEDNDTITWIGTYGNGIHRYNQKTGLLTKCKVAQDQSVTDTSLYDYCETMIFHNDTIWLASRIGGLGYIDPIEGVVRKYVHKNYNQTSVYQISNINTDGEVLLIGTMYGKYHELHTQTGTVRVSKNVSRDDTKNVRVTNVHPDNDGSVWISTNQGVQKKNKDGSMVVFVSPKNVAPYGDIFCVFQDSRNIVWFGNWGSGLSKYYAESSNFEEINLKEFNENHINCLYELNDSIMYLGSTSGVLLMNKNTFEVNRIKLKGKYADEVSKTNILGITSLNEQIVVTVDGSGIFSLDSDYNIKIIDEQDDEVRKCTFITSVTGTGDGKLWVGTWSQGIYMFDMNTGKGQYYCEGKDERLNINTKQVYKAYKDHENLLWIGTKEGGAYFDTISNKFVALDIRFEDEKDHFKSLKEVKSIVQDEDGVLWFAASEGLVSYSKETKKANIFGYEKGVLDVSISDLIVIGDDLWAVSKSTIMRLDTKTLEVRNYTSKDGLLPNSFNSSLNYSSNGLVFICNGDGIEVFDPKDVIGSSIDSEVFFEKLFIDDVLVSDSIMGDDHLSKVTDLYLDHNQNNLSFLLSVLNYSNKNGVVFAHKLIGFNETWKLHDAQHNQINYTNLSPGEYQLYITVLNSDDSINESKTKVLNINVKAPFWQKWWFIILVLLLFVVIVFGGLSFRTRAFKAKNLELEKYANERTIEIKKQNLVLQEAFKELEEKDQALNSNLNYASLLQTALQPIKDEIPEVFKNKFVMYKPRDVVSGDFYWSANVGDKNIFIVADCTGHGVSGAFISVLGVTFTRFIVKNSEITRPDLILNHLHREVSEAFHQSTSKMSDGMDMSVVCYDHKTKVLEIAGALNSPIVVEEGKDPIRIKSDRFPIGGSGLYKSRREFSLTTMKLTKRTMLYQFTDGFQDQFGGDEGKKFMQKRFRELLVAGSSLSVEDQNNQLNKTFSDWKKNENQVDDVLVVGLEIIP